MYIDLGIVRDVCFERPAQVRGSVPNAVAAERIQEWRGLFECTRALHLGRLPFCDTWYLF